MIQLQTFVSGKDYFVFRHADFQRLITLIQKCYLRRHEPFFPESCLFRRHLQHALNQTLIGFSKSIRCGSLAWQTDERTIWCDCSVMEQTSPLQLCGMWKTLPQLLHNQPPFLLLLSGLCMESYSCRYHVRVVHAFGDHPTFDLYNLHCPRTFLRVPLPIFLNCVQKIQNNVGPCLRKIKSKFDC